ncbi:unnamed protein product [Parascedosporium putredinis]|uniref:Zn(2)-C6 fungal-type domain-containing protein n=1 Tax=Parascedosporium putredinis TaxID=1442378 RepID=A0A9P1HBI0_9PEZI|nr:unnamed protein product [Parascedosporium putredinis]CAI8003937.1 unnamed protein product [Parascedosporium putredinis]
MRRSHKKSRRGCKECKLRHIKCDETRPSCVNCQTSERRCSYLESPAQAAAASSSAALSVADVKHASRSPSSSGFEAPARSQSPRLQIPWPAASTANDFLPSEQYSLLHLELLHHYTSEEGPTLYPSSYGNFFGIMIKEAFSHPYLMDELLAISAIHLSTLFPARKTLYLTEATRLQSRAISQFNAHGAHITEDNFIAPFMFSAFIGQHVIFEAFSARRDFSTFLESFVQCLGIHRGIRTIAATSWPKLQDLLETKQIETRPVSTLQPGDECALLPAMIAKSGLAPEFQEACLRAIECTQHMFDYYKPNGLAESRQSSAFQEWPVRVSVEYVTLLEQRRPEALVILAYYAALLHYTRYHWAVGDVGAFFIQEITRHLGSYWGST